MPTWEEEISTCCNWWGFCILLSNSDAATPWMVSSKWYSALASAGPSEIHCPVAPTAHRTKQLKHLSTAYSQKKVKQQSPNVRVRMKSSELHCCTKCEDKEGLSTFVNFSLRTTYARHEFMRSDLPENRNCMNPGFSSACTWGCSIRECECDLPAAGSRRPPKTSAGNVVKKRMVQQQLKIIAITEIVIPVSFILKFVLARNRSTCRKNPWTRDE